MQLNRQTLAEIADRTEASTSFFNYLARRQRNARRGESKISSLTQQMLESGYTASPKELLPTLRELDNAGIIELRGDKFVWKVGIKTLMSALDLHAGTTPKPKNTFSLVVCLDNDRRFTAEFPSDLTKAELDFVTKLLATQRPK